MCVLLSYSPPYDRRTHKIVCHITYNTRICSLALLQYSLCLRNYKKHKYHRQAHIQLWACIEIPLRIAPAFVMLAKCKKKKANMLSKSILAFSCVVPLGLDTRQTDPKPVVLSLHHGTITAYFCDAKVIIFYLTPKLFRNN